MQPLSEFPDGRLACITTHSGTDNGACPDPDTPHAPPRNDDAWIFIDDQLAIDLGGVATPDGQYVALDRLDLTDGQEYQLDFFLRPPPACL